jgi:hypothetical protein
MTRTINLPSQMMLCFLSQPYRLMHTVQGTLSFIYIKLSQEDMASGEVAELVMASG